MELYRFDAFFLLPGKKIVAWSEVGLWFVFSFSFSRCLPLTF
jgi:hypothetical protein